MSKSAASAAPVKAHARKKTSSSGRAPAVPKSKLQAAQPPAAPKPHGQMNGSEIFVQALKELGLEVLFGYPGGAALPLFDALYDPDAPSGARVPFVLVRHEQGATHMAGGYYSASGKVAGVLVTSGPGATNCVTGIATAMMDSIPMLVFTGQVPTNLIGNDAFQEADITGITRPVTKYNWLVKDVRNMRRVLHEAFHVATTGRPGPVLVDLPKDVLLEEIEIDFNEPVKMNLPGYNPTYEGNQRQIERAAELINASQRPVLYVGGGMIHSPGSPAPLRRIAESGQIPCTTTLMGLGAFDENHPLSLKMLGMHGSAYANYAVTHCDLLIAVGARFDDRVTGKIEEFSKYSKKIHIDIDPTAIAKNVQVDVPIVGDARRVLEKLAPLVRSVDRSEWSTQIDAWKQKHPFDYGEREIGRTGALLPQYVIRKVYEVTEGQAIITSDVGQHQMWTAQLYEFTEPYTWVNSGGLGTMGYGFPAALGAKMARPDKPVVAIVGDGGVQMCLQEMTTAVKYGLNVKVVIINNMYLGMVRQWQELFYGERYSQSLLDCGPDYVKLAEAYGGVGYLIEKVEDVRPMLEEALALDKPVLMDFRCDPYENVYPMVPAGGAIHEMVFPKDIELI